MEFNVLCQLLPHVERGSARLALQLRLSGLPVGKKHNINRAEYWHYNIYYLFITLVMNIYSHLYCTSLHRWLRNVSERPPCLLFSPSRPWFTSTCWPCVSGSSTPSSSASSCALEVRICFRFYKLKSTLNLRCFFMMCCLCPQWCSTSSYMTGELDLCGTSSCGLLCFWVSRFCCAFTLRSGMHRNTAP